MSWQKVAWLLLSCLHLLLCSNELERVPWATLPGRQLLLHSGKGLNIAALPRVYGPLMSFRRLAQWLAEEATWDSGHVEQYLVRMERGKRSEAHALLRSMLKDRRTHYLPMDTWVIAMSAREAAAAQHVDGVHGVYKLPANLKISHTLLSRAQQSHLHKGDREDAEREGGVERGREGGQKRSGGWAASRRSTNSAYRKRQFSVLDVLLGRRNETAAQVVEKWRQLLSAGNDEEETGVGEYIRDIRVASPERLSLHVHERGVGQVSDWLSHMHQVVYVEARPTRKLRILRSSANDKAGGGNGGVDRAGGANGDADRAGGGNGGAYRALLNYHEVSSLLGGRASADGRAVLWQHGLNGSGQIIGLSDTGVDYDSCYFRDVNTTSPGSSHRKVAGYRTLREAIVGDAVNGHGTHIAGTIAGNVLLPDASRATLRMHDGIAPAARLVVDDVSEDVSEELLFPDSMFELLTYGFDLAARIHSMSWGDSSTDYTTDAREIDEYMYEKDDFLVVVAAGNDGVPGAMTVGTPATAKNILAVGATTFTMFMRVDELVELKTPRYYEVVGAQFGPRAEDAQIEGHKLVEYPGDPLACTPSSSTTLLQARVALIKRGVCTFEAKVKQAQAAGAIAAVIYNVKAADGTDTLAFGMADDSAVDGVTIPAVMIGSLPGLELVRLVRAGGADVRVVVPVAAENVTQTVADWSARGPTPDRRIKPDVVVPGTDVVSARSDGSLTSNQCGTTSSAADYALTTMSGTSMAAPLVAGAAAIVRQYFEQGRLMNGMVDALVTRAFGPSAALVKGIIIHSAASLMELDSFGMGSGSEVRVPNFAQGYGSVDLSRVLWLGPATSTSTTTSGVAWQAGGASPRKLRVTDGEIITDGQIISYCVSLTAGSDLGATLVWTDPAALPFAARVLINDLDLRVIGPDHTVYLGNANVIRYCVSRDTDSVSTSKCAVKESWDTVAVRDGENNVETVRAPAALEGNYLIQVIGRDIPGASSVTPHQAHSGQIFALVLTGGDFRVLDGLDCKHISGCGINSCGLHGTCQTVVGPVSSQAAAMCKCQPTHTGEICEVANPVLTPGSWVKVRIEANGWVYVVWPHDIADADASWEVGIQLEKPADAAPQYYQDPDWYLAWNRQPSFEDWDFQNVLPTDDAKGSSIFQTISSNMRGGSWASNNISAAKGESSKGFWVLGLHAFWYTTPSTGTPTFTNDVSARVCLSVPGSVVCSTCPLNYNLTAATNQSHCKCNPGFKGQDGGGCTGCAVGKYNGEAGSTYCSSCPVGSSSPAQSTVLTNCTCNAGWSGHDGGPCNECVSGKYKTAPGPAACSDCGAGKYSGAVGATGDTVCSNCAAGTYSGEVGAIEVYVCSACPTNSASPAGSPSVAACICIAGWSGADGGQCEACTEGKVKAGTGSAACSDCEAGKHSSASGASADSTCTACVAGKFKSVAGFGSCDDCPAGSDSPIGSSAKTSCSCNAGWSGPAGGPCSASSASAAVVYVVKMAVSLSMTQQDFTEEKQIKFRESIATAAVVKPADVTIDKIEKISSRRSSDRRILTDSIRVDTIVKASSESAAASIVSALTPDKINRELEKAGLPKAVMLEAPKAAAVEAPTAAPVDPPVFAGASRSGGAVVSHSSVSYLQFMILLMTIAN